MLKKISLLKELATKIGRKKAYELLDMIEGTDAFVAEVKIKRAGIESKKEEIILKDNQKIIFEYVQE